MTPAEIALAVAFLEGFEKLYADYKAAKAALPTAAQAEASLTTDLTSLQAAEKADDAAADLAASIKFPAP